MNSGSEMYAPAKQNAKKKTECVKLECLPNIEKKINFNSNE